MPHIHHTVTPSNRALNFSDWITYISSGSKIHTSINKRHTLTSIINLPLRAHRIKKFYQSIYQNNKY